MQIAPVVEKVSLKKRAPKRQFELGTDWVQNMSTLSSLDVYGVIRVVLDRMREMVDADRASLFLLDRKRNELWSRISDEHPEIRLKSNAGIVGFVAMSGTPLNIEDAYKDARFNRRVDAATGYRTRTILCLPVKNQRGEVIGVIQCINKKSSNTFTKEDHINLDEFAWQCADMLEFKASLRARDAALSGSTPRADADSSDEPEIASSTGDGISLLLHLVQSPLPEIQVHASASIGLLSRNDENRERIVALRGVPLLLGLAMPWPWRSKPLLRGISVSLANLCISDAVRRQIELQGGWKALVVLSNSSDPDTSYDALRALANLALHQPLQRPMLAAGALEVALSFASRPDIDLKCQAVRLAANLSSCCRGGADASSTKVFSKRETIKTLGDAALDSAVPIGPPPPPSAATSSHAAHPATMGASNGASASAAGGSTAGRVATSIDALPAFAAAYAKLSLVPAIALWLFDVTGIGLLEAFVAPTTTDDVRVHAGSILASCLRQRVNQRIVLDMLQSHDPTEPAFRDAPTSKQRFMLLRERDALRTGKDVRRLMERLLYSKARNPLVYVQYARMLANLASEPSNHQYMLKQPYLQQLVQLTTGPQPTGYGFPRGDTQAEALKGVRMIAEKGPEQKGLEDILPELANRFGIIPILMNAAREPHEETQAETCRIVRALAQRQELAHKMVRSVLPLPKTDSRRRAAPGGTHAASQPPASQAGGAAARADVAAAGQLAANGDGGGANKGARAAQPEGIKFLELIASILTHGSPYLQIEACQAVEPFAVEHRVAMAQAKVIGALIALTHSPDHEVRFTAGRVLKQMA